MVHSRVKFNKNYPKMTKTTCLVCRIWKTHIVKSDFSSVKTRISSCRISLSQSDISLLKTFPRFHHKNADFFWISFCQNRSSLRRIPDQSHPVNWKPPKTKTYRQGKCHVASLSTKPSLLSFKQQGCRIMSECRDFGSTETNLLRNRTTQKSKHRVLRNVVSE